jgi:hypothetical protein
MKYLAYPQLEQNSKCRLCCDFSCLATFAVATLLLFDNKSAD